MLEETQFYQELSRFASTVAGMNVSSLNRMVLRKLLEASGSSHAAALVMIERIDLSRLNADIESRIRQLLKLGKAIRESAKAIQIMDFLQASIDQKIVFVNHLATLSYLHGLIQRKGISSAVYQGSMTADQKSTAIQSFRDGRRVLLASGSGGEGHNLQFCHILINYDLPWNPIEIEQCIVRLHRINQEKAVEVYNFCNLPEEVRLGGDDHPLLYGSPILDRLVQLATAGISVAYGAVSIPYIKKAEFDAAIVQDLSFINGKVQIGVRAETKTNYMIITSRYVALSDERKEGLMRLTFHEPSGAIIEGFDDAITDFECMYYRQGNLPPQFSPRIGVSLQSALKSLQHRIENDLAPFLASMRRRLHRDVTNTREYYRSLAEEMRTSLAHPNLSDTQRMERQQKIDSLPVEADRKIADLQHKYDTRIHIRACAGERYLVDVAQLIVTILYRKATRMLPVFYNPVTRRIDPLVCESCKKTTRRVVLQDGKTNFVLVCPECSRT